MNKWQEDVIEYLETVAVQGTKAAAALALGVGAGAVLSAHDVQNAEEIGLNVGVVAGIGIVAADEYKKQKDK